MKETYCTCGQDASEWWVGDRIWCDRCNREVESEPLDSDPIVVSLPEGYHPFSDRGKLVIELFRGWGKLPRRVEVTGREARAYGGHP